MQAKMNGQFIEGNDSRYLTQILTLYFARHFPFQTMEQIKENVGELFLFISEHLSKVKESTKNEALIKEIASLNRKINFFLKRVSQINTKENTIRAIYNFLLSLDGLSTLPGFGMSNNFGDQLKVNPEKQSIYREI